jgi:hypothetical protein
MTRTFGLRFGAKLLAATCLVGGMAMPAIASAKPAVEGHASAALTAGFRGEAYEYVCRKPAPASHRRVDSSKQFDMLARHRRATSSTRFKADPPVGLRGRIPRSTCDAVRGMR